MEAAVDSVNTRKIPKTKMTTFQDLPPAVFVTVISFLPKKKIIDCRLVCRSWYNMITESHCSQRYEANKAPLVLVPSARGRLCMVEIRDRATQIIQYFRCPEIPSNGFSCQVVGNICNGLVCVCRRDSGHPVYVWDPIGQRQIILPRVRIRQHDSRRHGLSAVYGLDQSTVTTGIGLNPNNGEYKVIRLFNAADRAGGGKMEAEINTLVSDKKWRNVGQVPYRLDTRFSPTYCNGALHWIVEGYDSELICSFDMESERFLSLPPPPAFFTKKYLGGKRYTWSNLGVIRDCLYITATDPSSIVMHFDIWVMKNYGAKESWTKVQIKRPMNFWWTDIRLLQVIDVSENSSEVLLCRDGQALLQYNFIPPEVIRMYTL